MSKNILRWVAILGRRDTPTDGIEDYCCHLQQALQHRGISLELLRVAWAEQGWRRALRVLDKNTPDWRGGWALVQYTALSWSRRGFPFRFLLALRMLRRNGVRCVVVFHDALPHCGTRMIDRVRRACQLWVMRQAYEWSSHSVLTIPLEKVNWLPAKPCKASFIPIGANLPALVMSGVKTQTAEATKTVVVFGITGEPATTAEIRDIGYAVRRAKNKIGQLRLVAFGRGSLEAEPMLRREFEGSGVEAFVLGVLPPEDAARELAHADVLLFVRGGISSRRGSALAGVACSLPVVGYRSEETAYPITEAGVVLVPLGDRESLSEALMQVLERDEWRRELRERSWSAQQQYFSWDVISQSFGGLLGEVSER
jgi:glycosyltransferase involved in cell wall biosynthesis